MTFAKISHILCFLAINTTHVFLQAKLVSYSFPIKYATVNYTGKPSLAMTIDGTIPGPAIYARVGDILQVTFTNNMDVATSIHWHGVLLPNDQDGVPYLTTPPIQPGASFTYCFPIKHAGTYWYHAHTGLQEQRGLYGALVFYPKRRVKEQNDHAVVFSDWNDEFPLQVLRNLKRDGHYYAFKKNTVQSWDKVLKWGWKAIKNRLQASLRRMTPMDISDIAYDRFLANGKPVTRIPAKPGSLVKLRLINAGAGTYFIAHYAGGKMKIIAVDGVDIKPIDVDKITLAIAETYDVIIQLPQEKIAYELRATAEDGSGWASVIVGEGNVVQAATLPSPNLFLSTHHHRVYDDQHGGLPQASSHDNHHDNKQNDYAAIEALKETALPKGKQDRHIALTLTGNMDRYTWSFDNKPLSEKSKIYIRRGENVRMQLINKTMMHHPVHLHGHFFRVLNGRGKTSPLKHTVNVPAMGEVTIEFAATEDKDWFFHCHNLYHMHSGMARIIAYQGSTTATKATVGKIEHDTDWHAYGTTSLLSHVWLSELTFRNTRNALLFDFEYDYKNRHEVEGIYVRNITFYLDLYGGFSFEKKHRNQKVGIFGAKYVYPLLLETDFRVDTTGHFRFEVGSRLQLTKHFDFAWYWNTDKEYRVSLRYAINKKFAFVVNHDSEFKTGAGLQVWF